MTHLRVEQNTITENVTSNVIHKLYETAKSIIDNEELNEVEESQVSLRGNLQVPKAYGDEVDWLEAKFPNLHINVTGSRYIKFKDNEVLSVLLANNIGDGTGITEADVASVTKLNKMFAGNTAITSFKEFAKFPITEMARGEFNGCTNLKELSIPRTLNRIDENALSGSGLESIVIPNTVTWVGARPFGQNSDYLKHIIFEDGFKTTYNPVSGVTGISFGKITKDGMLEELVLPDNFGEYIQFGSGMCSRSMDLVIPSGVKWFEGNVMYIGPGVYGGAINSITFTDPDSFIGFYSYSTIEYLNNNPSYIQNIDWTTDNQTVKQRFLGQSIFRAKTFVNFPKDKILIYQAEMFNSELTNPVSDILGNNAIRIGFKTFNNLGDKNEIITIPASCKSIGYGAFGGTRPTLFRILATTPPAVTDGYNNVTTSATDPGIFSKNYGQAQPACRIQVPAASLEAYKTTAPWSFYADKYDAIPE